MPQLTRITRDPAIMGGKPCIRGMRVTREHNLPCDDQGHVQFPDVRVEYDIDGRDHTLESR
jgi:hypothetical protein